jgi:hypothetical protein
MGKNPKIKCAKENCRSWAMRDSTVCRVHNPELPPTGGGFYPGHEYGKEARFKQGNTEGRKKRKHGVYSKFMTVEEKAFLVERLEQPRDKKITLEEELAIAELGVARAIQSGKPDIMQRTVMAVVKIKMMQREMNREDGQNEIQEEMNRVLRELGLGEN